MEFFATCAKGFEQLLADELRGLGAEQVRPLMGQVSFVGEQETGLRACLWSRIASRIVAVLARVDAHDSDALYASLRHIDWTEQLSRGASFAVEAHGTNAELRNTQFVAVRVKDALVDELFARRGSRPQVDVSVPDLAISLRISRNRATVGINLPGEPLFRRGYELPASKRLPIPPLRSDYAAALLHAAGWPAACDDARARREAPRLMALNAGAGTILVEAAGIALDQAPGLTRVRWGFEGWAQLDNAAWAALYEEARERAEAGRAQMVEITRSGKSLTGPQRQMLASAGLPASSTGEGAVWLRAAERGMRAHAVVGDLSWVPQDDPARQAEAYANFSDGVIRYCAGARMAVLAADALADRAVGCAPIETTEVLVGRSEATIRRYELPEEAAERPVVALPDGTSVPVYVEGSAQFAARLTKVAKLRKKWAQREDVSCYRVYDADLPDYALTIDLFEESLETVKGEPHRWLQISEYAPPKGIDETLARMRLFDALAIAPRVLELSAKDVFVRTRTRARGGSQYADEAKALAFGSKPHEVAGAELPYDAHLIDEGGLVFEVNFKLRHDCGIFLDHRDTRAMLREMAKQMNGSKRFLNLFAYTGTATCYAADGGARHTTTVDLSRPSLEWARRNMVRNGFGGREHEYVQADVLVWVREQRRTANRWDLIFCDVPTFSNSRRMRESSFDVQRDHAELLISISRLLTRGREGRDGGVCVFSCNLRAFKPDVEALAKAGVSIEDITAKTIPEDFARNQRVHHCYLVRRT